MFQRDGVPAGKELSYVGFRVVIQCPPELPRRPSEPIVQVELATGVDHRNPSPVRVIANSEFRCSPLPRCLREIPP